MTRPLDGERADDPLSLLREGWRAKARQAKNTWARGTERIEAAMEDAFREDTAFASELVEREGHRELASKIRMHSDLDSPARSQMRADRVRSAKMWV